MTVSQDEKASFHEFVETLERITQELRSDVGHPHHNVAALADADVPHSTTRPPF